MHLTERAKYYLYQVYVQTAKYHSYACGKKHCKLDKIFHIPCSKHCPVSYTVLYCTIHPYCCVNQMKYVELKKISINSPNTKRVRKSKVSMKLYH